MERMPPEEVARELLHDAATLRYFVHEADRATGVPSLATMVVEGREVPGPTALSEALKREARAALDAGPGAWKPEDIDRSRYAITDVVEDLRCPRAPAELQASVARLHAMVADHYLRSRQMWSARGKTIPRRLTRVCPSFASAFDAAFDEAFRLGACERLFALCGELLAPDGGWLFDGYDLDAPESWRRDGAST